MSEQLHLKAQLLAEMLELLMELLPEEHSSFLDHRDTEMFTFELVANYLRPKGSKGAP